MLDWIKNKIWKKNLSQQVQSQKVKAQSIDSRHHKEKLIRAFFIWQHNHLMGARIAMDALTPLNQRQALQEALFLYGAIRGANFEPNDEDLVLRGCTASFFANHPGLLLELNYTLETSAGAEIASIGEKAFLQFVEEGKNDENAYLLLNEIDFSGDFQDWYLAVDCEGHLENIFLKYIDLRDAFDEAGEEAKWIAYGKLLTTWIQRHQEDPQQSQHKELARFKRFIHSRFIDKLSDKTVRENLITIHSELVCILQKN